jgi:hypothetical protein
VQLRAVVRPLDTFEIAMPRYSGGFEVFALRERAS